MARILGSSSSHGGVLSFLRSDLDRLEDSPFLTAVLGNPFGSWSCGGLGAGVAGLRTSVGEDDFFDERDFFEDRGLLELAEGDAGAGLARFAGGSGGSSSICSSASILSLSVGGCPSST